MEHCDVELSLFVVCVDKKVEHVDAPKIWVSMYSLSNHSILCHIFILIYFKT